ncbi:hypothetical protein ACNP8D_005022, partial [Escherichia coli]
VRLIKRLQQFLPDALPVVRKTSWHCTKQGIGSCR